MHTVRFLNSLKVIATVTVSFFLITVLYFLNNFSLRILYIYIYIYICSYIHLFSIYKYYFYLQIYIYTHIYIFMFINPCIHLSGLLLVFVNKTLLELMHTHVFMYYLWLLSSYNGRIEQLQRPYDLKDVSGHLQKKFANSCTSC